MVGRLDAAGAVEARAVRGSIRLDGIGVRRVVKHRQTGQPLALVDDVTVSIYPGELGGLMGPSGAGKTTMMLSLNGYERPTAGQVLINGEDLYVNYDRYRGLIGYVPRTTSSTGSSRSTNPCTTRPGSGTPGPG